MTVSTSAPAPRPAPRSEPSRPSAPAAALAALLPALAAGCTGGGNAVAPAAGPAAAPVTKPYVEAGTSRTLGDPASEFGGLARGASAGTLLARSADGSTCVFADGRDGWNRAAC